MEKLILKRNILLKSFLIIYVLLLFSVAMLYMCPEWLYNLMDRVYSLGPIESAMLIAQAQILMKIAAFVFFLAPALAIQWEIMSIRRCEIKKGE